MTKTSTSNWTPWYKVVPDNKVECLICGADFSKKKNRMLSHLGYVDAKTGRDTNVGLCKLAKPHVFRAFRDCEGVAPPPLEPMESQHLQGSAGSEELICQGSQSSTMHASCGASENHAAACGPIPNSSGTASQVRPSVGPSTARSLQQSTIPALHAEKQRRKLDMAWAEFFYSANIPFATARSASFKKAVRMTSEMRTSYLPPSYHSIRKKLLDETKLKIKAQITERSKMFIRTYGATLAGDGWSDVKDQPLLNMMCVSPAGEEFLGAIDTSGHAKDAIYIANVIKKYLVEVGPENVVQVCTDNASVMKKAVRIVQQQWPHLYFQGCMAHALNLLLQDWSSADWASSIVEDAQKIVKFIRARHIPLALFRKHAAIHARGLSLVSPTATRFATNFLMVDRLLDVKEALKQTVSDVEWDAYVRTLSDRPTKPLRAQARDLRTLILSDDSEFWQSCANYCTVMKAAVAVLREFDGKQPCMGNVYMLMRTLRQHVAALLNAPFNMPNDLVVPLQVALNDRRLLVHSDLHYAGALLNPHLIKDMELRDDQNAMAGLMRVFQNLTDTAEEFQAVKIEFNSYFHAMPPYYGDHVWSPLGVKELPHLWWFTNGSVGKMLPRIARRILAQVVSSSSCERNWSSYSFVHSKARNRLLPSRAEDLVYIYTNSRVLNQAVPTTDEAAIQWYMQTVVSEDSDSDGPADLPDGDDDVPDDDVPDPDGPNSSTDDESTEGRSEEHDGMPQHPRGIGEDGRDLQDWARRNQVGTNTPHVEPRGEREQSLPPANSFGGDASLRTNPLLHGTQGTNNQTEGPNDELQDTGTSPTAPGDNMASQERPMHGNVVPPTNPVSPSRNEVIVQDVDRERPAHCLVLPSGIDGVGTEGNAPIPALENINSFNAAPVDIHEVATPLMPPPEGRQLFRTPADVLRALTSTPPSIHPTAVGPDPSPRVPASVINDIPLRFMEAFQRNRDLEELRTALPRGNVSAEVPHTTTVEQGGPSNHVQPMHETFLSRDTSTRPLRVVPPTVPSRASSRLKAKNVSQSSLGDVATFVADLRTQTLRGQSTSSVVRGRLLRSRAVEGVPTNNVDIGNAGLLPTRALAKGRRPRSDASARNVTNQTKRNTEGTGPSQTGKKTKNIGDFGCPAHVSENVNDELSSDHGNTSHAEAPCDSDYSLGD
jgi:Protein of unknown function (DUF 659)/hAT family C-terminal dimerisation region